MSSQNYVHSERDYSRHMKWSEGTYTFPSKSILESSMITSWSRRFTLATTWFFSIYKTLAHTSWSNSGNFSKDSSRCCCRNNVVTCYNLLIESVQSNSTQVITPPMPDVSTKLDTDPRCPSKTSHYQWLYAFTGT